MQSITIIPAHAVLPIRAQILRPGMALEHCHFDGDELSSTYHLGGFINGELKGIVSLMEAIDPRAKQQRCLQLRGMATLPEVRGQGLGKQLVAQAISLAKEKGYQLLWCNARSHAVPFYLNLGFDKVSEEFDIPGVGPHYQLRYRLTDALEDAESH